MDNLRVNGDDVVSRTEIVCLVFLVIVARCLLAVHGMAWMVDGGKVHVEGRYFRDHA